MLHFCIDFQTFHTRQNWFHSLTFPHFMSIHVTFPHFSQKHFSSILGSPFLLCSFMPPPPQFDQLQKQGNMVYRMQEIHMTILEKYENISRQFSVSATYVAYCRPPEQPLLWQVRPAASNCCPSRTSLNPICAQIHKYTRLQIQILFNTQIHATKTIEIQMNFSQHIFT